MKKEGQYIAFAPLQGYTDAAYRRAHWECAGGVGEYYTPFVRIEKGVVRRKDLRDTDPEGNRGVPTVPQVIVRDGKQRAADALDAEAVRTLAQHYPNNRANAFLNWFVYSDNTIDGQSKKKAYSMIESGILESMKPGTVECLIL